MHCYNVNILLSSFSLYLYMGMSYCQYLQLKNFIHFNLH